MNTLSQPPSQNESNSDNKDRKLDSSLFSAMDSCESFKNKLVLVTGASRGIGLATAEFFAKLGCTVIGTATSDSGVTEINDCLARYNSNNSGIMLKLPAREEIDSLFKYIAEKYNQAAPDILVNNAGITSDNLFMRMKPDEWDNVVNVNLTSIFYLTKSCVRHMVKQKYGRIINIGSVVGSTGNPGQANYCAAKAGVLGFTKSLAIELGSRGITVNTVSPGYIETDMTNKLNDDQKAKITSSIPLGRVGNTFDIAGCVVFLASNLGNYITGQTIHVNGGMFMS